MRFICYVVFDMIGVLHLNNIFCFNHIGLYVGVYYFKKQIYHIWYMYLFIYYLFK